MGPTLLDVEFIDILNGWAVGLNGSIWKTENGGDSWDNDPSGTEENLIDISFVDNGDVGIITGANKTLLRYDNVVNNITDSNISVSHNYPNPFNTYTTFNYTLFKSNYVEIRILDLTGRLIELISSSYQEKGIYSITWAPNDISSGIYLAQIKTAKSFITEKIIFLK
jgi:hypothetical protein